jgi:outer membrane usher protein
VNPPDFSEKATPSRRELGMRLALLPALILGALAQKAHAAAIDPAADPAAAADPVAALGPAAPADPAAPVNFDQDFFPAGHGPKVDISRFEKGNVALPGTYRGDVTLNGIWRARGDIVLASVAGKETAQPCFDAAALSKYGIDLQKVAQHTDPTQIPSRPIPDKDQFCGPLGDYIPGASATFDSSEQTLSLSIPQIYVQRSARGYVDPSQWDAGINAGVLNYSANVFRSSGRGTSQTSAYVGVNASLDIGAWHLVHQGSGNWEEHRGSRYQNTATFLQHDIPAWKAQAVAGDVFTSGDILDSVRISGVRMYTDDRMLPQSLRGFAPVVRGVASGNAKVQVKQRGYVIYETTVAPGPFVIDDLYPTGFGGDLDVEVTEADGRIERFSVPYASVPQLLRPGQDRWEVAIGKVNQLSARDTPFMAQATYRRGLTNTSTLYGGASFATGWHNILVGGALNTDFGAFSTDLTQGRNKVPGQKGTTGLSLRLGYNKNIEDTGTNVSMAAYRYSTSGFVGLNESVAMRDAVARGQSAGLVSRPRSRLDASIYQTLGDRGGQLYFSGSATNYWNRASRQVSFSAGYSNQWRSLSYSFSAQRTRDRFDAQPLFTGSDSLADRLPGAPNPASARRYETRSDTTLFFTLSLPLGKAERAPMFNAQHNRSHATGTSSTQVGISGIADSARRLSYNASLSHAGGGTSGSLYGNYSGSRSNISAGYSHGSGYNQTSASASGALVAHAGGVTLSPPTGDTVGLIHAPGAEGARVQGGQGSTVDSRGYALVPYLQPYQLNDITLDPENAPASVEFDSTIQSVAPRAGSVVRLAYKTNVGRAILIDSRMEDGKPVPFGADVFDEAGNSVGVVGQAGRVFVRGLDQGGPITVRWGEGADDSCRIQVPAAANGSGKPGAEYEMLQASCSSQGVPGTAKPQEIASAMTQADVHGAPPPGKEGAASPNDSELR